MASIADLCWTTSEDLFRDVDLDDLYVRQAATIGLCNGGHPYLVLVHTGKITIAIHLGKCSDRLQGQSGRLWEDRYGAETDFFSLRPLKEPSE